MNDTGCNPCEGALSSAPKIEENMVNSIKKHLHLYIVH